MINFRDFEKGVIFTFKEKHMDQHFVVHSTEEMNRMFAKVVKLRHEEGYWYVFEDGDDAKLIKETENLVLVKNNAIDLLGESHSIIKEIDLKIKHAERGIKYIEMQRRQAKLLDLFLKGNNKAANELCDLRRDCQYEEIEIEFASAID